MPSKEQLRTLVCDNLDRIAAALNIALTGSGIAKMESILQRVGSGNSVPHWFTALRDNGTLPNLDGKTIGKHC